MTFLFAQTREERIREFGSQPFGGCFKDPRDWTFRPYCVRVILGSYPNLWKKILELGANPVQNLERLKESGLPVTPDESVKYFIGLVLAAVALANTEH